MRTLSLPHLLLLVLLLLVAACGGHGSRGHDADSTFAGVQARGARVMGVDQEASEHIFEDLPDGGRILYRMKDMADTAGARIIAAHLEGISRSFAAGDFRDPMAVHDTTVPGTATMAERKAMIRYTMSAVPGGGELRLVTSDSVALAAIHEFLAFQRSDHRAAGHEGMDHGAMDHGAMRHDSIP